MKQPCIISYAAPHYQSQRNIFLSEISEIICSEVTVLLNDHLNQILMYGSNVYIPNCNKLIIEQSILFIKSSRNTFLDSSSLKFNKFPEIPLHFNLYIIPVSQTSSRLKTQAASYFWYYKWFLLVGELMQQGM